MSYDLGKGKKCLRCDLQLCTCPRDANGKPLWILNETEVSNIRDKFATLVADMQNIKSRLSTIESKVSVLESKVAAHIK